MIVDGNKIIKNGYAIYGYDNYSLKYKVCKWYLYPIFRTIELLTYAKYRLYRWLNIKGIMKTPVGQVMLITDIPIIKQLLQQAKGEYEDE